VHELEKTKELNLLDDEEEISSQAMDKSAKEMRNRDGLESIAQLYGEAFETHTDMEISEHVHILILDAKVDLEISHIQ